MKKELLYCIQIHILDLRHLKSLELYVITNQGERIKGCIKSDDKMYFQNVSREKLIYLEKKVNYPEIDEIHINLKIKNKIYETVFKIKNIVEVNVDRRIILVPFFINAYIYFKQTKRIAAVFDVQSFREKVRTHKLWYQFLEDIFLIDKDTADILYRTEYYESANLCSKINQFILESQKNYVEYQIVRTV